MIGSRFWILCQKPKPSLLMSPHDGRGWKPGEVEIDGRPWIEISMGSHNGVYAAKSMRDLENSVMTEKAKDCLRKQWWDSPLREFEPQAIVFGRVRIWGTVIEHERGYRAEHAKVCSLDKITYGPEFITIKTSGNDLEALRLMYGVNKLYA